MNDVIKFSKHPGFALLLAAASCAVIFGLYPKVSGLVSAYSPKVYTASVPNSMMTDEGMRGNMMGHDGMEGGMMDGAGAPPAEQI